MKTDLRDSETRQSKSRTLITRHSLQIARRGSARILLVEDNLSNQEVVCGMLRRLGLHADVACNGKQALQALEAEPYDLVLMNVQMPEMDSLYLRRCKLGQELALRQVAP